MQQFCGKLVPFTNLIWVGVLLAILYLNGCGNNVCVMGMGECDKLHAASTTNPPSTTGTNDLRLNATTTSVLLKGTLTLTISGGRPPYSRPAVDGGGTVVMSNSTTITYTAPDLMPRDNRANVRVYDSANNFADWSINLR